MSINEENLVEVDCVVCNSTSYETIFKVGKDNVPINFSICCDCGLAYLNPRWTKLAYNKYYANEYDTDYRSEVLIPEKDSEKYLTSKQVIKRLSAQKLLPENPKNILDVGSGMGWSSVYLKNHVYPNASFHAIEPSLHCQENLKSHDIDVITGDIDSNWNTAASKKFDLIIMRHVLEHFMNPVEVLKKVSSSLSENGILYIAVPNTNRPGTPMREKFFRVVHTYYFTPESISNCFNLSGLNLLHLKENDADNPYEMYCVLKQGTVKDPKISSSEYQRTKSQLLKQHKREQSGLGLLQLKAKRRIGKILGK